MKKFLSLLTGLFLVFVVAGSASATTFEVGTNGSLSLGGGFVLGDYTANTWGPIDLAEGQSSGVIEFFTIDWYAGLGDTTITANVDFISPTGPQSDQGETEFLSLFGFFSAANIEWGDPLQISYGNGGLFTLDLYDVSTGWQCGSAFSIFGDVTNVHDSNPVPEPATMLLFGLGLLGLAGVNRRKK